MSGTHIHHGLVALFGTEYTELTIPQRMAVEHDFNNLGHGSDDCVTGADYKRNIGVGNLASYADCLVIGHLRDAGLR